MRIELVLASIPGWKPGTLRAARRHKKNSAPSAYNAWVRK